MVKTKLSKYIILNAKTRQNGVYYGSNKNRKVHSSMQKRKGLDAGGIRGKIRREQQDHFKVGERDFP